MQAVSTNKKITSFIVLFPPIILLVYAVVSYLIIFSSERKNTNALISYYEYEIKKNAYDSLKTRAISINNFIDSVAKVDKKLLIILYKSIDISDNMNIFVYDYNFNKAFFKTKNVDIKSINRLKNIDGPYEDNEIIAFSKKNSNLNLNIVVYDYKNSRFENLNRIEQAISNSAKTNIKKSFFWLALVWFILLFISFYISILVFNRLKEYEKLIRKTNESIVFNSRQAMLGELLPMIAHQWRQPLNQITSLLMRMRMDIASGSPNTQNLDRNCQLIEDSVDMMSNTVEDFRTFYRPKEKESDVEISELVRKAIYFLDELLKKRKISINLDLTKVSTKIHSNELLQVFINLIKNASDAMDEGGNISIYLKDLGDRIEFRIEDEGTGIPEDKLEKIFEPHESSKQASMGLGLYMARLIIENRLGGKIGAYNTERGAGFIIVLPKK